MDSNTFALLYESDSDESEERIKKSFLKEKESPFERKKSF